MKIKLLTVVFVLISVSNTLFAQNINAGIKLGGDLHKLKGKSFDEEFKLGYHVGAFAEIKLKKIGIQPELYFSQVNTKTRKDGDGILPNSLSEVKKIKFSYLNIPVLANLYFNKNVAFQLGPQFGILVDDNSSLITNGKDAFKKGDFSIVGGLQLKISRVTVFGRYIIGLNDRNDIANDISNEKWKSQTIHLGLGYSFL